MRRVGHQTRAANARHESILRENCDLSTPDLTHRLVQATRITETAEADAERYRVAMLDAQHRARAASEEADIIKTLVDARH